MKNILKKLSLMAGYQIKAYTPPNYGWMYERNIKAVLDIGANTGQYAQKISKILPTTTIFSFEPILKCYGQLVLNTKNLNIKTFNFGLGDREYESEINISQHSPSSSLLKMTDLHTRLYKNSEYNTTEKIKIKMLDAVAPGLNISGQNYLVKVDVQGFEDKVLLGGYATIEKAQIIQIETTYQELYKGQPLFDDIYRILNKMGFEFAGNNSQKYDPSNGKLIYSDSIFLKKN